MGVNWKDWCWSWNSNILATWCEEMIHLRTPWFWERLRAGGEGDNRGWDGWMASPIQWTWFCVDSGHWWWTERPGILRLMGSQRVRHGWATELNWTLFCSYIWSVLLAYFSLLSQVICYIILFIISLWTAVFRDYNIIIFVYSTLPSRLFCSLLVHVFLDWPRSLKCIGLKYQNVSRQING